MNKPKLKIAFIKFAGLSAGGSERFMQILASNLPKDRFEVDYFTCEDRPYLGGEHSLLPTDAKLAAKLKAQPGVKVIEFNVDAKDLSSPYHKWLGTDFWEKFNEKNYDLIQIARAGHKEYPFNKIRHTPIIDSVHLNAGVDNQYNISRVMHLNNYNLDRWVKNGGDKKRAVIIINPLETPSSNLGNLKQALHLEGKFVYGFHQRPDDSIFSPIPLQAYKKIETDDTAFVLLGGGESYKKQAKDLNIKNIHFLPPTGELDDIYKFLATLNVYAHGRRDGEVNSRSMAEAMFFALPIVSHTSPINNGHIESIGSAGRVVSTIDEYIEELVRLRQDENYYKEKSKISKNRFDEKYSLDKHMGDIVAIYEDAYKNPFPHVFRRILFSLHWTQNIRIWAAWIYLKLKYKLGIDLKKLDY